MTIWILTVEGPAHNNKITWTTHDMVGAFRTEEEAQDKMFELLDADDEQLFLIHEATI